MSVNTPGLVATVLKWLNETLNADTLSQAAFSISQLQIGPEECVFFSGGEV